MYLGDDIGVPQNVNDDEQNEVLQPAAHGHEAQQGYPQESVLGSTDSSIMTNLMNETTQTVNVTSFGTHPPNQRGPAVRLNGMQGVKTKSGHKSGHCPYCQKWFHRLSLHKCKISPEFQGTHRENIGSKRKAPPREVQMIEDMQFKTRQEDFMLELQQVLYRGHVELGLEMHLQMFYSNRVLFHEFRTPQISNVTSVIGEPMLAPLPNDLVNIGNATDGVKDAVSKAGGWGLHENSHLAGNPIGGTPMMQQPPQKFPNREVSNKNTTKLMTGGNDGGISRAAELILRDGRKKVKKGTHSLRFVEDEQTGQPKWLRCLMCPTSRYSVHAGKTPFACESCENTFMHPDCFMEYHKTTNLPLDNLLCTDFVD